MSPTFHGDVRLVKSKEPLLTILLEQLGRQKYPKEAPEQMELKETPE